MKTYLVDLVERVGATFAVVFLSSFSLADLSTAHDAAIAAGAAALTLVKGALARFVGDESAGLK